MNAQRISVIVAAAMCLSGLVTTAAGAALPHSSRPVAGNSAPGLPDAAVTRSADLKCQRRITTDDMGVCCRLEGSYGRHKYFRTSRRNCQGPRKTIVDRKLCPRRPRGDGSQGVVCCQYDDTPGLGPRIVGKRLVTGLMGRDRCMKKRGYKIVSRNHCVKKRSKRDRMLECRKRGRDWVWKNGRCRRASVRDKRD